MQVFLSILLVLVIVASISFLILQARMPSHLKWIGYALLLILLAFGWGVSTFLPNGISDISEIGIFFVGESIVFVIVSSSLIRDLRRLQQERREGLASVWHQQPNILKKIGWVALCCSTLFLIGSIEYMSLDHYFFHHPFHFPVIPGAIIPLVLICLFVVLHCYVLVLRVLKIKGHSY